MTLRLTGFSKREDKEIIVLLQDGREKVAVEDCYYFFESDTLIQCREFDSGVLLEELELRDLFNKPNN